MCWSAWLRMAARARERDDGRCLSGSYVLTATTSQGPSYAPTFTGNGFLGVRGGR